MGWSSDLGFAPVDPEVRELARAAAVDLCGAAGLELVDIDVQLTDPVATWLSAGALSNWLSIDEQAHWPDRIDDLTPLVQADLRGSYERPARTLVPGLRRRLRLQEDMAALFAQVDVLLLPDHRRGRRSPPRVRRRRRSTVSRCNPAMSVPFTMLANLCWNPAISVPAGQNSEGLPVGLQVIGPRHRDEIPLRLARLYEQARPWPRTAPTP